MELIKNKVYRAELVDYTADGAAVARIGGIAVFVPGGAVGDQCDIRIVKVNRRMAFGRIEQVVVRSKSRVEPACPHAGVCGGCCWQHISYEEELRAKRKKVEDALQRIGGLQLKAEAVVGAPSAMHYRNKAQYPVGQGENGAVTGFYRARSHEIVPITHCGIQSEKADQAAALVRRWMDENHVPAYDEASGKGVVRHVYVRVGDASGQAHVCIVAAAGKLPAQAALVSLLTEQIPSLVGIVLNINRKPGNAILGKKTVTLWGEPTLEDILCGNVFRLSPQSFYQVNHAQAERLYACALEYAALDGAQTVVELYCGAGTITLAMARRAARVIGVEVVPEAVENARENAGRNGLDNVEFICADAGQSAGMLAQQGITPDVVVVDPPRKGLDDTAIGAIGLLAAARVVYVSCDPATLARDIKLLEAQGYTAARCRVFDLFPRTAHVETVALLTRKK
ncbi:23S rRNA (uracil(1939)-C(5))-methyltransferase RlmD [Intestinibacillus massiliensis]|uniref:23S rRNA (uracil(1939)-C(5))-methyltransferase RlmD n=1 Tax=Intestinibacillus massiliensis TaxID=1871029 RepID=UPI000B363759|nr:23S rRNA (uracil(1939)-C(5))-methyltransferase RlmD [Intestinibacillus massiliensis]